VRCTAFFLEIKEYKKKRGRRTMLKRTYRLPDSRDRDYRR
jgi:hypothetical protein